MSERIKNIVKWVLIVFGILFLIQILIALFIIFGLSQVISGDFNMPKNENRLKEVQKVINYVEEYNNKNHKYPPSAENIRVKNNISYKYVPTDDYNCYSLTVLNSKNPTTKEYRHCKSNSENSSSNSESYVEYQD